jgi:hypothetical protein
MKKLLLSLLLLVNVFSISGQNVVDIKITNITSTYCEVTLYPSQSQTSILSNVVFTLKWKNSSNLSFGNPTPNSEITILPSGPILINESWKYQIYYGIGFIPTNINNSIIIRIPKSGKGAISITNDNFVNQLSINGAYYVSIGGQDVTGNILTNKNIELEEPSLIIMYFDPSSKQFYIKRENEYYNMVGQKVILFNINELIIVHKNKQ